MRDKSCRRANETHQYDDGKEQHDGVKVEPRDGAANPVAEDLQQTAVCDAIAERDTAHGDEHDRPKELLEVVLQA